MPRSPDLLFATSNDHKYSEASEILGGHGLSLGRLECDLVEIQSPSLSEIASKKAADALLLCSRPVIAEDAGLFVDSLNGFPGPYSAFVHATMGCAGVLRAMAGGARTASFCAAVAYAKPGAPAPRVFESRVRGTIAHGELGDGWGYDPIFVPEGSSETYAQMPDKSRVSHRALALGMLAGWLTRTRQSCARSGASSCA
ncbi:MAG: non-canonical purine NTP pyrophosphatase [Thaumarchaeota archaeon S13]|nr:MAG: non-canonical purine NTP pyrophosphatase [Thaumarchaeota archaeon S13]